METIIIQAIIYVIVITGALLKVFSKIQQDGKNYFNAAHAGVLIVYMMAVLGLASQTVQGLNINLDASAITIAVLITALLAGWGAGDLAYQTANQFSGNGSSLPASTPTPAPAPTSTPTPTPAANSLSVKVTSASGIPIANAKVSIQVIIPNPTNLALGLNNFDLQWYNGYTNVDGIATVAIGDIGNGSINQMVVQANGYVDYNERTFSAAVQMNPVSA